MQIQRVNINRYSSNRVQQPSANSQNFGMRLVLNEQLVSQLAKGKSAVESLQKEATLHNMCEDSALKDRFIKVFERIYKEHKDDFIGLPEPSQFNPRVIQDWDKLKIKPFFYLDNEGHIVAELTHDKKSGLYAKGKTLNSNRFGCLVKALDKALDNYARMMIYEAIGI